MVNRDWIGGTSHGRKRVHFQVSVGADGQDEVVCGPEPIETVTRTRIAHYREETVVVARTRKGRSRSGILRLSSHSCHDVSVK